MKVLITGASGFIGRNLCAFLNGKGYFVRGTARSNVRDVSGVSEVVQIDGIDGDTDWRGALVGVDTVVHLAGRVHVMHERANDSLEEFRRVNVLGTERLARMAVKVGVRRFVFASSVKVNGEGFRSAVDRGFGLPRRTFGAPRNDSRDRNDKAYTEDDEPRPEDAYGISKMEAEQVLKRIADETGLEVVILRLPVVYGLGVKANFRSLIKLAVCGLPLPFKSINNKRSFLYVGNLTDAIIACIENPKAAGETFLVSDGQDVSTPELMRMIGRAMGEGEDLDSSPFASLGTQNDRGGMLPQNDRGDIRLFYVPLGVLRVLCRVMGKGEELEKLTRSLVVDSSKIRNMLGWKAPFTMEEGIRETVERR